MAEAEDGALLAIDPAQVIIAMQGIRILVSCNNPMFQILIG